MTDVYVPQWLSVTIAYAILCLPGSFLERVVFDAGDRVEVDIWVGLWEAVLLKSMVLDCYQWTQIGAEIEDKYLETWK